MMKRQKKQLLVMGILLVAGILAYVGIRLYNQKSEERKAAEEEQNRISVTDFAKEDITEFSYTYEGELQEYVKEDGTWYNKADRSLPMDSDAIDSMLAQVSDLSADSEVTDYESLADYGLDTPVNTLTFHAGEDEVTLLLGDKNEILSQYYVKRADKDTVYLISVSLDTVFAKSANDLKKEEESTDTEMPKE